MGKKIQGPNVMKFKKKWVFFTTRHKSSVIMIFKVQELSLFALAESRDIFVIWIHPSISIFYLDK
jgi:hypothetical protein